MFISMSGSRDLQHGEQRSKRRVQRWMDRRGRSFARVIAVIPGRAERPRDYNSIHRSLGGDVGINEIILFAWTNVAENVKSLRVHS